MSGLTAKFIQTASGGHWLVPPRNDLALRGVRIDSRDDLAHCAFLAIRGTRHDGHDFLDQAVQRGAAILIVERELPVDTHLNVPTLLVQCTRHALLDMARAYRRLLRGTVIAITGSAGKTTTKQFIHSILSSTLCGSAAPKSFNNDIGVPLTILNAAPDDDYLVLEIGTNAPGEIDLLASIASPHIAVITSIGRSHLETLGSIEAVAREKACILNHVTPGGCAVVHDTALLTPFMDGYFEVIRFGRTDVADLIMTDRGSVHGHWWFELNGTRRYKLNVPGEHNAMNALASVAVARRMSIPEDKIAHVMFEVTSPSMRMARVRVSNIDIINDAYNANPESMAAALRTFAELTPRATRRVLLLGDMLELGAHAAEAHGELMRNILDLHASRPLGLVVLLGPHMCRAAESCMVQTGGFILHTHKSLDAQRALEIAGLLQAGDVALLKGSRGMAMERIIDSVQAQHGSSADAGARALLPIEARLNPPKQFAVS